MKVTAPMFGVGSPQFLAATEGYSTVPVSVDIGRKRHPDRTTVSYTSDAHPRTTVYVPALEAAIKAGVHGDPTTIIDRLRNRNPDRAQYTGFIPEGSFPTGAVYFPDLHGTTLPEEIKEEWKNASDLGQRRRADQANPHGAVSGRPLESGFAAKWHETVALNLKGDTFYIKIHILGTDGNVRQEIITHPATPEQAHQFLNGYGSLNYIMMEARLINMIGRHMEIPATNRTPAERTYEMSRSPVAGYRFRQSGTTVDDYYIEITFEDGSSIRMAEPHWYFEGPRLSEKVSKD